MRTFLRQPASASQISRSYLSPSSQTTRSVLRGGYIARQPCAYQHVRRYAADQRKKESRQSKNEELKRDEATSNAKDAPSVVKQTLQPAKPPRGFEYLYKASPLSILPETEGNAKTHEEELPLAPGFTRLSPEEEKVLNDTMKKLRNTMPTSISKEVDKAFKDIRKHGVPEDLVNILKDQLQGKPMSLSMAARLVRVSSQMARVYAEMDMKRRPQQQSQPKHKHQQQQQQEEGPFFSQQEQQKKKDQGSQEDFKWSDVKLDTSTFLISAFAAYFAYRLVSPSENLREITWQEFQASFLNKGLVDRLTVVNGNRVKVHVHRETVNQIHPDSPAVNNNFFYFFTIGSVEAFERKLEEAQKELSIPSSERIPVAYKEEVSWASTLLSFGPTLLLIGLMTWGLRRASGGSSSGGPGGIFGMGKSRAKRFNHETDIKTRFKDVAGMDEAKAEIMEFVSFLKEPGRFQRLGAKIPRGAILSGPPGTGKTLLAKATAGESQVPFFSVSGSEFVEMFVGVGPSRVRDLFANARKSTPCIIFIDEIDAIGKSRAKQSFGGGNDERESTLNQILTEMDGFNTSEQVVVLAGTNRPDVLDSALMRPGRFDRHIAIDRPTMEGRKQIFGVHLRKIITDEDRDHLQGRLAALTPGFSGADIANCCNEAALIAAREGADRVIIRHFEAAIERTVAGLEKKSLVLNPEEKKIVAYHEAGHAICGWFFKWADPLLKVSIIPRGSAALGYAMNVPGDNYLMNVNQLMDRMAMTLGGRVSEELHFDTVTSGASDDFNKVTRTATAMVTKWGMSSKIGYLFYEDDSQSLHKPFSEETARHIDTEVRRIVDEAYKQCRDLLTEKKKEVGIIAEELLRKEMLDRDDMIRLLGKRPFDDRSEFLKYFGEKSAPPPPPTEPQPNVPPDAAPAIFKKIE